MSYDGSFDRPVRMALEDGRWHKLGDLAADLGLVRRDVENAVQSLRLQGHPIVASGVRGVCLTDDPARLEQYVQQRRERGVSEYAGTRALRRTARRMREQADTAAHGTLGL